MAIRKRPDSAKPGGGKKKPGFSSGIKRDGFKSGGYKGKAGGSGDDKPRFRAKPTGDKPYARKTSDSGEYRKTSSPRSGSAPYKKRDGDDSKSGFKRTATRSFEKREGSYGDRKPSSGYKGKSSGDSSRPPRKYGDKPTGDRYVRKSSGDDSRPPRKYGDKPTGDRFVRKSSSDLSRPPRKYGDKPAGDRFERKSSSDSRPPRKYGDKPTGDRFVRKSSGDDARPPRKYGDKPSGDRFVRKSSNDSSRPPRKYGEKPTGDRYTRKPDSSDTRKENSDTERPPSKFGDKPLRDSRVRRPASGFTRKDRDDTERPATRTPRTSDGDDKPAFRKPTEFKTRSFAGAKKEGDREPRRRFEKPAYGSKPRTGAGSRTRTRTKDAEGDMLSESGTIRLNRYISNAGICSRREADKLIGAGLVSVNGTIITEMGHQVNPGDVVKYNNSKLSTEKKVYLLMNKPKDMITTLDDPDKRKIVTDLLKGEDLPRVYPVGRLDRNTTGVLLLTNDGEMAQRLMHPKYEVQKIYKATLDKNFKGEDLWTLTQGVELEDGFIKPDSIAVPDPAVKNEVGIEIHSGRNRIIHRMFEHVGYSLDKLDRVLYAGLSRKSLKRGEWRMLEEREISALKKLVKLK
ncbi:MAG: pseudouridine synthase [Bacteroidia bacterium]|jgi:23S rRNA pseudouridine2605 synthase